MIQKTSKKVYNNLVIKQLKNYICSTKYKFIMIEKTKDAILRIVKRADKCDKDILVDTFVNLGSLIISVRKILTI